jgi:excisionase family DNA binding protein
MENQVLIQKTTLPELQEMIGTVLEQYLQPAIIGEAKLTTILTRRDAAKMLGVSLPTLHFWTKEGIVKGTRIGSRVRYRLPDLEAALIDIETLKYKRK